MRTRTLWYAQEQALYLNRIGEGTFARRERRRRQIQNFTVELWRRMDVYDLLMTRHYQYDAAFNLGIDGDLKPRHGPVVRK